MTRVVIFGGTTEGRKLCELCGANNITIIYCVTTEDGARCTETLPNVSVSIGQLNDVEMTALLKQHKPALAIDATHPYAEEASRNIRAACERASIRLIRVTRESAIKQNCEFYGGIDELLSWLEQKPGNIFATTGSSSSRALTKLPEWQSRVWLRLLPNINSLRVCLDLGYRPERLICMHGPFSEELNRAMFRNADAKILVTKDSGVAGGYTEKVRAAKNLGMAVAVLSKPEESDGVSLDEAGKIVLKAGT